MKRQSLGKMTITAIAVLFLLSAAAASGLEVPPLTSRVTDLAGIVSSGTEQDLSTYLQTLEDETGIQVAVLTIPSLEGEVLEQYSIQVVDEWGLGSASEDNGALLLVALQEKKIRIEVGYGLEGNLTDAATGLIIREILQPAFRSGDYDGGIATAVHTMGEIASGRSDIAVKTTTTRSVSASTSTNDSGQSVGFFVNLIVFMIIFSLGSFGRRRRYGGVGRALFWGAMLGSSGRHRTYRSGGFGGGGFGGGGFGGGGFSGGGGGFGGGGASGGW